MKKSDKVREEISKVLNEPGRRENAQRAQEALDRLPAYVEKRRKDKKGSPARGKKVITRFNEDEGLWHVSERQRRRCSLP